MTRLPGGLGLVAVIVLLVVLGGRLIGLWSDARTAADPAASTAPARVTPLPPPHAAPIRRTHRSRTAAAARARRRWIRQANAICRRAAHETAVLGRQLSQQQDLNGLVRLAEAERRVELRTVAQLRRLQPPPGSRFSLRLLVAAGRRRDRLERRVLQSVRKRDLVAAFELASDLDLAEQQFGALAAALGADSCGQTNLDALATTALNGIGTG